MNSRPADSHSPEERQRTLLKQQPNKTTTSPSLLPSLRPPLIRRSSDILTSSLTSDAPGITETDDMLCTPSSSSVSNAGVHGIRRSKQRASLLRSESLQSSTHPHFTSPIIMDSDGVLTINTTPDPQRCHDIHCGCGSSLGKVKRIVRQLLRSERGSDEVRKLENVRKVVVKGRWDEREIPSIPDITVTPEEDRAGIVTEQYAVGGKHAGRVTDSPDPEESQQVPTERLSYALDRPSSADISQFDLLSIQDAENSGHSGLPPAPKDIEANKDKAITYIVRLLGKIKGFEEMTWISELPFSPAVWITVNPETLTSLELDLARPGLRPDGEPASAFSSKGLSELQEFANLRSLTISGMLQSYQRSIWEGVWCMPFLESLDLRMTLEPALRRGFSDHWPYIQGSWRMRDPQEILPAYHGDNGKGVVHSHYGYGEYLDSMAIENARDTIQTVRFKQHGFLPRQLSIKQLVLGGFVVDSMALQQCFDLSRMQKLVFAYDCVDAGLAIKKQERDHIEVAIPRSGPPAYVHLPITPVARSDLQVVTLRGKRIVRREPVISAIRISELEIEQPVVSSPGV